MPHLATSAPVLLTTSDHMRHLPLKAQQFPHSNPHTAIPTQQFPHSNPTQQLPHSTPHTALPTLLYLQGSSWAPSAPSLIAFNVHAIVVFFQAQLAHSET